MIDASAELEAWLAQLELAFGPANRRRMAAAIAAQVRKSNAARIRRNVDPTGKPFVPRKKMSSKDAAGKLGRRDDTVKAQRMFRKTTSIKTLRRGASDGAAWVGFVGSAARIMRVHQLGLRDRVSHTEGAPVVKYPVRELLGLAPDDVDAIYAIVAERILDR